MRPTPPTRRSRRPRSADVGRVDRTTTDRWGSVIGPYYFREPDRHTFSGAMSYVTGAHALKVGFQLGKGSNHHQRTMNGGIDLYQEYHNKVPASVMIHNTPQDTREVIKYDLGIYVQDSLRWNRLTVNPGVRLELFNTYVPAQSSPAGQFVPARSFDKIENLPSWKDVAPRLGVVYDVFGDSKDGDQGPRGQVHARVLDRGIRAGLQPERPADRSPHLVGSEWRRLRPGQRDWPRRDAVQHQRRQQPASRSRYQASLPVGDNARRAARVDGRGAALGQLDPARLQAPVLERQRPHDV